MQTFLAHATYGTSAQVLDLQRLGKQIIEAGQILRALTDPDYGWQNHPATKMWRGHRGSLLAYATAMHDEWRERRGKDHAAYGNVVRWLDERDALPGGDEYLRPSWLGDDRVHESHKANLLRKDPDHYGQFGWDVDPAEGYVWPEPATA